MANFTGLLQGTEVPDSTREIENMLKSMFSSERKIMSEDHEFLKIFIKSLCDKYFVKGFFKGYWKSESTKKAA